MEVGGSVEVEGSLIVANIDVGGKVFADGEIVAETIEIGGKLGSNNIIYAKDNISVGSKISTPNYLFAEQIEVGGKISALEVICNDLAVGESIKTDKGIFVLNELKLGKDSVIEGPIIGNIISISKESTAEDIYGNTIEIGKRSKVENLFGKDISIKDNAVLNGNVEYVNYLDTGIDVVFEFEPKIVDRLPEFPVADEVPQEILQKFSELKK